MPTTDHDPYPTRTASWSGRWIDPAHLHANSRTVRTPALTRSGRCPRNRLIGAPEISLLLAHRYRQYRSAAPVLMATILTRTLSACVGASPLSPAIGPT